MKTIDQKSQKHSKSKNRAKEKATMHLLRQAGEEIGNRTGKKSGPTEPGTDGQEAIHSHPTGKQQTKEDGRARKKEKEKGKAKERVKIDKRKTGRMKQAKKAQSTKTKLKYGSKAEEHFFT